MLLGVLAALMVMEGGLRLALPHVSVDYDHIKAIPSIARSFGDHSRSQVLFLGNSLTRRGVNLKVVEQSWANMGFRADCRSVYPDDTTIVDWYYLFERYFPANHAPDLVVIGFARTQLSDQTAVHANRIAAHYGGFSIAAEALSKDITNVGDRVDFLLSANFRLFSERDRLRETILRAVIPKYADTAQALNVSVMKAKQAGEGRLTYGRLTRFIRMCDERGTVPLFVAMPLNTPYNIDPDLVPAITDHQGMFLDLRNTQGLTGKDFLDPMHLAPSGAVIYSERLAPALASLNWTREKNVSFDHVSARKVSVSAADRLQK